MFRLPLPASRGPIAPSRASGATRALRSRATSLRNASIVLLSFDSMPASERSISRRATSACKEGTSLAARRASFVSSTASLNLRRQAPNRDFHEPASLREPTSAQRSSSARASAASARTRSRSYIERKSRGMRSGTDTEHHPWKSWKWSRRVRGRHTRARQACNRAKSGCETITRGLRANQAGCREGQKPYL